MESAKSETGARKTKKQKRDQRRRSNWYIYLISFASTCVLLGLFILAFSGTLFPQNRMTHQSWDLNYVPSPELDTTVLFMMSDEQGSVPHKFMLMNYRPRDEVIVLVPLNEDTRIQTRNTIGRLTDLYRAGGPELVSEGIANTLGVECEFYVKFDRASFTGFTSLLGEIPVNVPFPFSEGGLGLPVGQHLLSGGDLFIFMSYANFPEAGADFNLSTVGRAFTAFINSNLRHMDDESINSTFNRVLNNATTNLIFGDYINYRGALQYTSNTSISPASFYIPSGQREAHEFVISPQSIAEIHERFNLIPSFS
jgi:anionic cell wall polymer biosynthesis LytR-Cps2A-Psr (LCP) family protein